MSDENETPSQDQRTIVYSIPYLSTLFSMYEPLKLHQISASSLSKACDSSPLPLSYSLLRQKNDTNMYTVPQTNRTYMPLSNSGTFELVLGFGAMN